MLMPDCAMRMERRLKRDQAHMMESSWKIIYIIVMGSMCGKMEESMLVNGRRVRWLVK